MHVSKQTMRRDDSNACRMDQHIHACGVVTVLEVELEAVARPVDWSGEDVGVETERWAFSSNTHQLMLDNLAVRDAMRHRHIEKRLGGGAISETEERDAALVVDEVGNKKTRLHLMNAQVR